jgi:vacuolar-type H+-ATPase subunit E/Vma4
MSKTISEIWMKRVTKMLKKVRKTKGYKEVKERVKEGVRKWLKKR